MALGQHACIPWFATCCLSKASTTSFVGCGTMLMQEANVTCQHNTMILANRFDHRQGFMCAVLGGGVFAYVCVLWVG